VLEGVGAVTIDARGTASRDLLDERIEQLAHHYTEAGLAGPAVAYCSGRASEAVRDRPMWK
jgi:hypothetical protein